MSEHEETTTLGWDAGRWTVPPAATRLEPTPAGSDLLATAEEGSDAWRVTSYGFTHDSAHGLLAPLRAGRAMEVEFTADFDRQFDQAGILLRSGPQEWIKSGIEFADGVPSLGAVVTHTHSDWSLAPVPTWAGRRVTVRASRAGDAVTIRARVDAEPFALVRLAYLDPAADVDAGPFLCAPTRAGLTVRFHAWRSTPADASLHG